MNVATDLFWAVMVGLLALALGLLALPPSPAYAQALAQPCVAAPCKITGAAVKVTIPLPVPGGPGKFAGKFELVPLFDKGHRPVMRNGHAYYAHRNTISFRTDAGDVVTVFAGATTDLASLPAAGGGVMPPYGPWAEAAAFHDSGYKSRGVYDFHGKSGRSRVTPYTRAEVDEILREAMVSLGVPTWKRVLIYEAVRAFGGLGWGT